MPRSDIKLSDNTVVSVAVNNSKKKIRKLYQDGSNLVSNVQCALDARETGRRTAKQRFDSERKKQLQKDAEESHKKFFDVLQKWDKAKSIRLSHKIYQMFLEQKKACDMLVGEKDQIIISLVQELREKDEELVQEIKKQEEDTKILCKRVDSLVDHLTSTCRKELLFIEGVYEDEYKKLVADLETDFRRQLNNMQCEEMKELDERCDLVRHYQEALLSVEKKVIQEFAQMRAKLDSDFHALQLEVQRMQGVHLLNREKLELNLQVLKKQLEENNWLRVEQKRQLIKLHDVMVNLKRELQTKQKKGQAMVEKLTNDCEKLQGKVNVTMEQARYVMKTNEDKYASVWLTKEEQVRALFHKVMDTHRFVTEEITLGEWCPPETSFLTNFGPLYLEHEAQQQNMNGAGASNTAVNRIHPDLGINEPYAQQLLQLVAEDLGFLRDDKEFPDAAELFDEGVSSLDSLLKNLNIRSDSDIGLLWKCFSKTAPTDTANKIFESANVAKAVKEYTEKTEEVAKSFDKPIEETETFNQVDLQACNEYWSNYGKYAMSEKDNHSWDMVYAALGKYLSVLYTYKTLKGKNEEFTQQNEELSILLGQ